MFLYGYVPLGLVLILMWIMLIYEPIYDGKSMGNYSGETAIAIAVAYPFPALFYGYGFGALLHAKCCSSKVCPRYSSSENASREETKHTPMN